MCVQRGMPGIIYGLGEFSRPGKEMTRVSPLDTKFRVEKLADACR